MTATTTDRCPDCAAAALEPHAPGCPSGVAAQLHSRAELADETHRRIVAEGTGFLADSIIEDHDFGTALISLGMLATVLRVGADLSEMDRQGRIDLTKWTDGAHLVRHRPHRPVGSESLTSHEQRVSAESRRPGRAMRKRPAAEGGP